MKKLSLFLGMLVLSASLGNLLLSRKAHTYQFTPSGGLTDATRNRQLLFVYNSDNVTHEVGDVVVWYDGSTADGLEISTTATANNGLVAGVVAQADIAATTWGFIQVKGYHSAVTIGVANTAGDSLITSTTGEAAGVYSVAQSTGVESNQARTDGTFAVAFETTTTSTTVKAILK